MVKEGFLEEVRLHIGPERWAGLDEGKEWQCVQGEKDRLSRD